MASKYGHEVLVQRLIEDRNAVVSFSKNNKNAVIDSVSSYMDLLNPNNYQKGGWVLHMLRQTMGDEKFHQSLRAFYEQYKGKNADTKDFQKVVEDISGQNLDIFSNNGFILLGNPTSMCHGFMRKKRKKFR